MIEIICPQGHYVMTEKPIPDHYHKFIDAEYHRWQHARREVPMKYKPNRANKLGRHPFNIITKEVLSD